MWNFFVGTKCFVCGHRGETVKTIRWTESKSSDPMYHYHDICLKSLTVEPSSDPEINNIAVGILGVLLARKRQATSDFITLKRFRDEE